MGSEAAAPEMIHAAGKEASRVYWEFLGDAKWSASTRRYYASRLQRFFAWAESRGLAQWPGLQSIGMLEVKRTVNYETTRSVRYFVTSLS